MPTLLNVGKMRTLLDVGKMRTLLDVGKMPLSLKGTLASKVAADASYCSAAGIVNFPTRWLGKMGPLAIFVSQM